MSRQCLVVFTAIAAAVVGAGIWFLWPSSQDPTTSAATAGPYLVRLTGAPPQVGDSTLTVEVSGDGAQPPAPDSVTLEPAMSQMGHATPPVVAAEESPGHYRAKVHLPMAGQWEITVRIAESGRVHQAVLSVTTSG